MTLTELKKQLKTLSQAELIGLLCKVYKDSKQAQALIDVALCGDVAEQTLLPAYKKRVHDAFWGRQYSLKKARDAVLAFSRIAQNAENAAELMLYHVECGVDFTCEYGDIDEPFYESVESCLRTSSPRSIIWTRRTITSGMPKESFASSGRQTAAAGASHIR